MSNRDNDSVLEPQERIKSLLALSSSIVVASSVPINRYLRSGRELLRMANIYLDESNFEKAFILYTKYITLYIEKLPQHNQYNSCDQKEKCLTVANCKHIFPIAEQIKAKLIAKYQSEYDLWQQKKKTSIREFEALDDHKQHNRLDLDTDSEHERLADLQYKLDKHIEDIKDKNRSELYSHDNSDNRDNRIVDYNSPFVDRSTKPSSLSFNLQTDDLRPVIICSQLINDFLGIASKNSLLNIETCAILAGKLCHNRFQITHILLPKQRGTSDSCLTDNEEEVFAIQDKFELITIGWIHTHPSQNSFMSSIDLHTHCSYQLMLPEAIAIVCSPKFNETGVFSLTQYGLDYIAKCQLTGFHPHPTSPTLYDHSKHVVFDHTIQVSLIDLR